MAVKKISRWELQSASRQARGDQREQWYDHAKMTLSASDLVQNQQVVQITAPAGSHTWFLDELIETLTELRKEAPHPRGYQLKD